jgi:hypothetical protein
MVTLASIASSLDIGQNLGIDFTKGDHQYETCNMPTS